MNWRVILIANLCKECHWEVKLETEKERWNRNKGVRRQKADFLGL